MCVRDAAVSLDRTNIRRGAAGGEHVCCKLSNHLMSDREDCGKFGDRQEVRGEMHACVCV